MPWDRTGWQATSMTSRCIKYAVDVYWRFMVGIIEFLAFLFSLS